MTNRKCLVIRLLVSRKAFCWRFVSALEAETEIKWRILLSFNLTVLYRCLFDFILFSKLFLPNTTLWNIEFLKFIAIGKCNIDLNSIIPLATLFFYFLLIGINICDKNRCNRSLKTSVYSLFLIFSSFFYIFLEYYSVVVFV